MLPVTLAMTLDILAAAFGLRDEGPAFPQGHEGELGLSDSELWTAIWTQDFGGVITPACPFWTAVNEDPRRVDAMVQATLLDPVTRPSMLVSGGGEISSAAIRGVYLARCFALRQQGGGRMTAEIVSVAAIAEWQDYRKVLDELLPRMLRAGDAGARRVAVALRENRGAIEVAFSQVGRVLSDAADQSARPEDAAAWRAYGQTMEAAQAAVLLAIDERLQVENFGVDRGSDEDLFELVRWSLSDSVPMLTGGA